MSGALYLRQPELRDNFEKTINVVGMAETKAGGLSGEEVPLKCRRGVDEMTGSECGVLRSCRLDLLAHLKVGFVGIEDVAQLDLLGRDAHQQLD